ncbi:MAG: hypothetical protein O8C58_03945 [Candidatus Methanoperedens sp.]|nr:hypothetical protein [Candidatus Methanoperedens sp.]
MVGKNIKKIVTAVIIAACVGLAYLFPATGFMAFVVGMVFGFPVAIAGYLLYCRRASN